MSKKFKVVIAEDHIILREGLKALLSFDPERGGMRPSHC